MRFEVEGRYRSHIVFGVDTKEEALEHVRRENRALTGDIFKVRQIEEKEKIFKITNSYTFQEI